MWNPFSKSNAPSNISGQESDINQLGFFQRMMMKKFMAMSDADKQKIASEMLKPENIAKNKDKIIQSIEQMEKTGMISAAQAREARAKFGI